MDRVKIFVIIGFFLLNVPAAFAQEAEPQESETPAWLKRIEYSIQYETDKHPTFYFQTVQPFYQSEDKIDTFFYQPRFSLKAGDWTSNAGAGYRRMFKDDLILGINIFGDFQDLHEHGRAGLGLEALGQILEGRINSYFGLTSKRVVEESTTMTTYEKVADGFDYELGAPIPYLPWLKIYGQGFLYNFTKSDNKEGWKSRLEATLNEAVKLEFYMWDDNKGEPELGGRVRFNFAFDKLSDFSQALKLSDEPFPKKELKEQVLIPVERSFDITVEKWIENKSGTVIVSIGRTN